MTPFGKVLNGKLLVSQLVLNSQQFTKPKRSSPRSQQPDTWHNPLSLTDSTCNFPFLLI